MEVIDMDDEQEPIPALIDKWATHRVETKVKTISPDKLTARIGNTNKDMTSE